MSVKKLSLMALFATIALIIFMLEALIPLPVRLPGLKLGLANTVTLFVLFLPGKQGEQPDWKARDAFMIFITRVLLAAFITGSVMSFIYSFTGGTAAFLVMSAMRASVKSIPVPVVSVAGGVIHNLAQLTAAAALLVSPGVLTYLPILIAGGIISGLLTGFAVFLLFELHPKFINHISHINK